MNCFMKLIIPTRESLFMCELILQIELRLIIKSRIIRELHEIALKKIVQMRSAMTQSQNNFYRLSAEMLNAYVAFLFG